MFSPDTTADSLGLTRKQEEGVREVLMLWQMQRRKLAMARMHQMARSGGERRLLSMGEVGMQIMPESYHHWGLKLGYECWSDETFCREYLRDVPESRVRSHADNLTLRVPGLAGISAHRKFYKTYNLN